MEGFHAGDIRQGEIGQNDVGTILLKVRERIGHASDALQFVVFRNGYRHELAHEGGLDGVVLDMEDLDGVRSHWIRDGSGIYRARLAGGRIV